MLAASYWSLLAPALSLAGDQGWGAASCVPVAVGLVLGAGFVLLADVLLPEGADNPEVLTCVSSNETMVQVPETSHNETEHPELRYRGKPDKISVNHDQSFKQFDSTKSKELRRLLLLVIAITVHNFPEGLAVGVGYASVGRPGVDLQQAHNLALGIGLQNFPEGLAVSVPLRAAGFSTGRAFFWGQASGMVEPLAGVIGVLCVALVEQILPVALAFAAGAMIWVVCNDIVPEAASKDNTKLCSVGIIVGFIVMMCLDTSLG